VTTIVELVDRASRRYAFRVAVVDGSRRLTFAEVADRSNRLANALLGLSPMPGSRVGLLLSNRLEFMEADFAIAKAGKVKAPINPRLADDERSFILANCDAEVLVTESAEEERVRAMVEGLPDLKHVIVVDRDGSYEDLLAAASHRSPGVAIDPDAPSMILHTSGTTGRPKGATTSQRARVAATLNMLLDEYAAGQGDGMVHMAPMSHGSGSKILAYFMRGGRNLTLSKFDPGMFLRVVAEEMGTSTFVVPTMIRMLLDAPERQTGDLSKIKNITYGGAPMPAALAEEAIDVFGPVLTQVYGSCEAPHPVTVLSRDDHIDDEVNISSAGRPTSGVEVRIVDESGNDVALGDPGEIWIRGENVMTEYWGDPAATEKVFTDGWYRSGDVGTFDERGYVAIVGREREMLISGGLNIYPAEVEAVLHRHRDISEAAVLGVPDDLWGEAVTAVIVPRRGHQPQQDDIVAHCREFLADYKKPRRIVFVESLPKGNTGKVSKQALLELVTGGPDQVAGEWDRRSER
jgi:acyl-CoA synthetase (AMP-forming)/AMP-acid ligase II